MLPPTPTSTEPPKDFYIAGFTLINAATDTAIGPLVDGTVIDLAAIGTDQLSIRAEVVPQVVGSVVFDYDDIIGYQVKNTMPYTIAGNTGQDYHPWTPTLGTHMLRAAPYGEPDGTGRVGQAVTINFTVIDRPRMTPTSSLTPTSTETPPDTVVVVGDLTQSPVYPLVEWPHEAANTAYYLYVSPPAGDPLWDEIYTPDLICTENVCRVVMTVEARWGWLNGTYEVWLGTQRDGQWFWPSTPVTFTVAVPLATPPSEISVEAGVEMLDLRWTSDANTYYVEVWIGNDDWMHQAWYSIGDCDAGRCALTLDVILPSGLYGVWMRAWGPGGIQSGATEGWVQGPDLVISGG